MDAKESQKNEFISGISSKCQTNKSFTLLAIRGLRRDRCLWSSVNFLRGRVRESNHYDVPCRAKEQISHIEFDCFESNANEWMTINCVHVDVFIFSWWIAQCSWHLIFIGVVSDAKMTVGFVLDSLLSPHSQRYECFAIDITPQHSVCSHPQSSSLADEQTKTKKNNNNNASASASANNNIKIIDIYIYLRTHGVHMCVKEWYATTHNRLVSKQKKTFCMHEIIS